MIFKVKRDRTRGFTMIGNEVFHDKRLSLKAIGLLCLLWSLPDDWDLSVSGLAAIMKDKKASIRSGLKELEVAGYIRFEQPRIAGKFAENVCSVSDSPLTDFPSTEELSSEKPSAEARTQVNNNKYNTKKEKTNKETLSHTYERAGSEFKAPTMIEAAMYRDEEGLNVDPCHFCDYYEARGWTINGEPVSDWRALMRSWESNGYNCG